MTRPSGEVDYEDPGANMYGCRPCPVCKSVYRAPFRRDERLTIECDDCGYVEAGTYADGRAASEKGAGG